MKEVPIVIKEESMDKKRGSISSVDSEIAKNFVCSENIEVSDIEELQMQVRQSWAQRQGLPTKSGLVISHNLTVEKW